MKRDIKLNISQLRDVESRITAVGDALVEITEASDRFLEILREQSSQAYEELSRQWEEKIQKKQETLSMLIRLAELFVEGKLGDRDMGRAKGSGGAGAGLYGTGIVR